MKKHIYILTIASAIGFTFFACTKSDNNNTAVITDAIIYDSGPLEGDGCGWIIKIPATDSTYSPTNLVDQYKINALKVHIRFHPLTTRYRCGWNANLRQIQIDNIVKTN